MSASGWLCDEIEALESCPLCGSTKRSLLQGGLRDTAFEVMAGEWAIDLCGSCGSGYLNPRPRRENISQAYKNYYTHSDARRRPISRSRGLKTLLHDLINDYQNDRYGTQWKSSNFLGKWIVPLIPPLRSAADVECRHLPHSRKESPCVLDVGCGNGDFLKLAKDVGWNTVGIDFDKSAIQAAREAGLNILHGGIELFDGIESRFDLITISHVIEHVYEPEILLKKTYSLLKPGGTVWLETPNIQSMGAKRFGSNWRGFEAPRHLVLFNREALSNLLADVGFIDIKQRWRGLSALDTYASSHAVQQGCSLVGRRGKLAPPLSGWFAEIIQMMCPGKREFLTFTARK